MPKVLKKGKCFKDIHQYLKQGRRWLKALVCLECVIFLIALFSYFWQVNHLINYVYDAEQLAEFTGEEFPNCFGGVIDENYMAGWYDVVPDMVLRKGYYQYSVKYESNAEGCAVWLYAYLDYHNANIENPPVTFFESDTGTISEEVWVNTDINAVLHFNYSGEGSVAITYFSIFETPIAARMRLFTTIVVLLVANLLVAAYCYQRKHAISVRGKYILIVLILTSIFASYPLFVDYAIEGHDFYFHLNRIEGIKDGLLSGQFPVRINPTFNRGYGCAAPILYGEIFLYFPAFMRLFGFPLESCYNIYLILCNVLTCFGGYYCFRKMFRSPATALAVTVIYAMSPYRLMNLYLRSAIGEFTTMAFLPFVVYGLYRIYTEEFERKGYQWCFLPLVIGLTGIIQSHILSVEMIGFIILFACVLLLPLTLQKKRFLALVKAFFATVGVNLWFIVPFIDFALTQDITIFNSSEKRLIQSSGLFFTQLLSLFQKYAKSVSFPGDHGITYEMPLTLGMPLVLGIVLCAVMICVSQKASRKEKRVGIFFIIIAMLVIFMSTIYFPWDRITVKLPFLRSMITSLEISWRFLGPATVLAAAITGFGLLLLCSWEGKKAGAVTGIFLCLLTILSGMQFMQEYVYENEPVRIRSAKYTNLIGITEVDYVPSRYDFDRVVSIQEPVVSAGGVIAGYTKNGTNVSFNVVSSEENCFVILPLLNYKGYTVTSEDGSITDENLSMGDGASVCIDIPEGFAGKITVRFREVWYWRLAEAVSVLVMAIIIVMYYRDKRAEVVFQPQGNGFH